jgi:exodeoxyribonuclease-3
MTPLRIVTWNVNSVRVRHDRLLRLVQRLQPSIICLQELKCVDDQFPRDELRLKGYSLALFGQKTYNGVAVLSREEITEVQRSFGDGLEAEDPQARFVCVKTMGVRVASAYIPNGAEVDTDKWRYKLWWLDRLYKWTEKNLTDDTPLAICGDYNIAPDDLDVRNPKDWADGTLTHPSARQKLQSLMALGLTDIVRKYYAEGGPLSWWDYRRGAFAKDDGLRIDHILANATLAARSSAASVDRFEREGEGASDHAPVLAEFLL